MNADENRKVLFLDIDGVMQPTDQRFYCNRFKLSPEEREQFPETIAKKTGIEHLKELDKYDVAAVYLDWHEKAIENLKSILEGRVPNVEIVLSSNWRETKSLQDMKALFAIHGLDGYLVDACPTDVLCTKAKGIEMYLEEHPLLKNYVIVDDENLLGKFPFHAVYCGNDWLDNDVTNKIRRVFETGFWWEHEKLPLDECKNYGFRKVVFLDVNDLLRKAGAAKTADEAKIRLLKYEILEPVNAELVIMGSWREKLCKWAYEGFPITEEFADCHELTRLLGKHQVYVSDITPVMGNSSGGTLREVREWINVHGEPEKYVIFCGEEYADLVEFDDHVITTYGELDGKSAYDAVQMLKYSN